MKPKNKITLIISSLFSDRSKQSRKLMKHIKTTIKNEYYQKEIQKGKD